MLLEGGEINRINRDRHKGNLKNVRETKGLITHCLYFAPH